MELGNSETRSGMLSEIDRSQIFYRLIFGKPAIKTFLAALLLSACSTTVPIEQIQWAQYENKYFVAFSAASEADSLALLRELEVFRTAFLQISNLTLPPDSPKTIVIITANSTQLWQLRGTRNVEGFATRIGEDTIISLPVQGRTINSSDIVYHEYSHILLGLHEFDYPTWYNEGFAELMSASRFDLAAGTFSLGRLPVRVQTSGVLNYDWNLLVSEEFSPHKISSSQLASTAYKQAWLLAHYVTIGDNGKNAYKLQQYFDRLKSGDNSLDAFYFAFDATPEDMWIRDLQPYSRKIPYLTLKYDDGETDLNFAVEGTDQAKIDSIIGIMRDYTRLPQDTNWLTNPEYMLAGDWGRLNVADSCKSSLQISVDLETSRVKITGPESASQGSLLSENFVYEPDYSNSHLQLSPAPEFTLNKTSVWHVSMPNQDSLCMHKADYPAVCGNAYRRCLGTSAD